MNNPPDPKIIPVRLTTHQADLLRGQVPAVADLVQRAVADGKGVRLDLSSVEIEELGIAVAIAANHCEQRKLRNDLDVLMGRIESLLVAYDK